MLFQPIRVRVIAELYNKKDFNLKQKQIKNLLFTTNTLFGFIVFQIRDNRQIFKFLHFRLKISGFSRSPHEFTDIIRIQLVMFSEL